MDRQTRDSSPSKRNVERWHMSSLIVTSLARLGCGLIVMAVSQHLWPVAAAAAGLLRHISVSRGYRVQRTRDRQCTMYAISVSFKPHILYHHIVPRTPSATLTPLSMQYGHPLKCHLTETCSSGGLLVAQVWLHRAVPERCGGCSQLIMAEVATCRCSITPSVYHLTSTIQCLAQTSCAPPLCHLCARDLLPSRSCLCPLMSHLVVLLTPQPPQATPAVYPPTLDGNLRASSCRWRNRRHLVFLSQRGGKYWPATPVMRPPHAHIASETTRPGAPIASYPHTALGRSPINHPRRDKCYQLLDNVNTTTPVFYAEAALMAPERAITPLRLPSRWLWSRLRCRSLGSFDHGMENRTSHIPIDGTQREVVV